MKHQDSRRYLINRGWGNEFIYPDSMEELAFELLFLSEGDVERALKYAHTAWDTGHVECGLVSVDRREPA